MKNHPYPVWLLVSTWWIAYSLVFSTTIVSMANELGQTISWGEAFIRSFRSWLTWIPLTLAIIWLVRRIPMQRKKWLTSFFIFNLAALLVVLIRAVYVHITEPYFHWYNYPPDFWTLVEASFHNNFLLCWLVIGVAHVFLFSERVRQREKEILELKSNLTQAKLATLSAQINPHFLFNALNSIAELMHCDPEKADKMVISLSSLLRRSLSERMEQEVIFSDEYELIEDYVEIEKVRLGNRLNVTWSIDFECLGAYVPNFLLQPIVENSIVHGISKKAEEGNISISVTKEGTLLIVRVVDDGSSSHPKVSGHGIGLRNIRERLAYLYGESTASIQMLRSDIGTNIEIKLPFSLKPTYQLVDASDEQSMQTKVRTEL